MLHKTLVSVPQTNCSVLYHRDHLLRQISIVEIRDPIGCHSVQDGRQILASHEEARERRTAARKEELSESIRDIL